MFVALKRAVDMQQLSQCFPVTQSEIDALCVQTAGLTLDAALIDDRRLALFGFTPENISMLLLPMLTTQKEALGSMGNDAPLACLSNFDPLVYEYFKQLFAQVTNPPIDPFRERIVMSLACPIGPEANVLEPSPHQAHRLWLQQPILSLSDMTVFRKMAEPGRETDEVSDSSNSVRVSRVYSWRVRVLEASFGIFPGDTMESLGERLKSALDELCTAAERAILEGISLLVLTDRNIGPSLVPIPSLLALGAVHQHLLRKELRMKCGLIVESGDAREVHHFCTLLSFGADAICPYMVFEIIRRLCREGLLTQTGNDGLEPTEDSFFGGYVTAVERGILKVMAKMGISTLHSYKAAQIFEAVGLASEVIATCFTGTQSRVGGATFDVLAHEVCSRHRRAFGNLIRTTPCANGDVLLNNISGAGDKNPHTDIITRDPGFYHWRQGGEMHMNDPVSIAKLQAAARTNSREAYAQFAAASDENARFCTLRGQLDFIYPRQSIAIEYVEPASEIVKKFATGAMSLGSISAETHATLAEAMNKVGGRSNTGEGGELPERYLNHKICSSIKQVASARFGVNSSYLAHADMLQIKMAQGAKPGEGGELPGHKVTAEIARLRHSVPEVGLISPPPHHDIYSIEDLAQLIYDLKAANPVAVVSVKLVSEVGVGVIAAGVAKAHAAHITVSGHDGGTGASSWTGIKNAGLPWELGIAETHQTLVNNHTRSRVVLQADGQIRTGRDVIIAALLGADEFAMSTAPLITLGCTMMRKCHLNTCPVGICTQDPVLRKKFAGLPEHLINYLFLLAEEVRGYLAKLGFTRLNDLTGRTDLLKQRDTPLSKKASHLDLSALLARPVSHFADLIRDQKAPGLVVWDSMASIELMEVPTDPSPTCRLARTLPPHRHWDRRLILAAASLIETPGEDALPVVRISGAISNEDRAFGASLSYAISMRFNEAGLPKTRRIEVNLRGHAGQSFCAFLAPGIYVYLAGDANDYVGKGLSGGQVTIVPPPRVLTKDFLSEEHIIVGNACLYGAIEGRAFIRGQAAERFCVRNSGAIVVAEGCGDHGCEYMTGGRVVLLGRCGRNFAAGMSGGLAFVYDGDNVFRGRCNMELVSLTNMSPEHEYAGWLRSILTDFFNETGSQLAHDMLRRWDTELGKFICVFPNDYKRALEKMKIEAEKSANEVVQDENAKPAETNNGHLRAVADIEDAVNGAAGDTAIPLTEKPDKLRGFVKYPRTKIKYRPPEERLSDWSEVYAHASLRKTLKVQTARCMDCGVPFCQSSFGCPLGNLIPTWNDLVFKDEWEAAHYAMMKTNNFPEFTGRVCPAPCEGACVLGIIEQPVAIKNVECAIGEVGWERGLNVPRPVAENLRTGKRIAIIGSGPSGLACAAQLIKVGHEVVVMERRNLPGGLLRYGIPTMKLDRKVLDRRLELMTADGVQFMCSVQVGKSSVDPNCHCRPDGQNPTVLPPDRLLQDFDATVLCLGSTWPRDLNVPGRHLNGIHFAMSFLERWQRKQHQTTPGTPTEQESGPSLGTLAKGKRVIVLGGGDTGVDCIATATRQGAISVQTLEIMPAPPSTRKHSTNPWPEWPIIWRSDYGHEEVTVRYGKDPRNFNILTKAFLATPDGQSVAGIKTVGVEWKKSPETGRMELVEVPGTDKILECDLVLLAMGFLGPEKTLLEELNLAADARSNIQTPSGQYSTSVPRIYAAGDCRRGQSLVVHAINEGRQAARQVDLDLMGHTLLPGPGGVVQPEGSSPVKCCT
ncbi:hypothetical protein SprV_0501760300 [Sparganum proliferum]